MNKTRLFTCILIVCVTMYLLVPKAFSLNPIETIVKTYSLVVDYE